MNWPTPRRVMRRVTPWWVAAVVLLALGAGSITLGLRGSDHPLPPPAPSPAALKARVAVPPSVASLATIRSVPVSLGIPALGISVSLGPTLGLNPDGSVQVPTGTAQPGWFQPGPSPGQTGSAVILGHVDSYQGPGIFFELRTLAAGDQLNVTLADGDVTQFTVNAVAMYSKPQFPAQRVYGSHGSSALQLVTCGGVFDQQTGSYLSNIVVYSSLTDVVPPAVPASPAAPAAS